MTTMFVLLSFMSGFISKNSNLIGSSCQNKFGGVRSNYFSYPAIFKTDKDLRQGIHNVIFYKVAC